MSKSFYEKVKYITKCWEAKTRVKGWFTGDAYQFHPHGFCLNGVLIYDHHNVNDYYTIEIVNTPEDTRFYPAENGRSASLSHQSRALPKFVNGQTVVWSSGKWQKKGAFKKKVVKLVDYLYEECKKAKDEEVRFRKQQEEKQKTENIILRTKDD